MTAEIIEFCRAATVTKRLRTPEQRMRASAAARRPRRSINGTPEQRAAKAAALASGTAIPQILTPREIADGYFALDEFGQDLVQRLILRRQLSRQRTQS